MQIRPSDVIQEARDLIDDNHSTSIFVLVDIVLGKFSDEFVFLYFSNPQKH